MTVMDYGEDSDLFDGVPPLDQLVACGSGDGRFPFLARADLTKMGHDELVDYAVELQKQCSRMETDNNFMAWEFRDVQKSLVSFSRAAELAHEMNAASLDEIAVLATESVRNYFNCDYAAVFTYDPLQGHFELYRSTRPEMEEEFSRSGDGFLAELFLKHRDPFVMNFHDDVRGGVVTLNDGEVAEMDIPEVWRRVLGGKVLVIPLHKTDPETGEILTLGGMLLGDPSEELESREADMALFFADLFASGLHNAQLVQRLNGLIIIDPLTQLYNRRHLINVLEGARAQADDKGHALSLVMADIDLFKRFNDQYGHVIGDEVLRAVAAVLREGVRTGVDVPSRYGGEEFLLVMPFTDLDGGFAIAERLRNRIKEIRLRVGGKQLSVTCSFGVAQYEPGESIERFVDRADEALYAAKESGRDRVCAAK